MFNSEVLSLLGLASRARKISTGDTLLKNIRSKQVYLVLIASDASENSKKKLIDKCLFYHVDYMVVSDIEHLSHAIGKDNRVGIGICEKGFANKIKSKLGG